MKIFSRPSSANPPPVPSPTTAPRGSTPLREYTIQALPPHRSVASKLRNAGARIRHFSFSQLRFSTTPVRNMQTTQGTPPSPRLRTDSQSSQTSTLSETLSETYQDPSVAFQSTPPGEDSESLYEEIDQYQPRSPNPLYQSTNDTSSEESTYESVDDYESIDDYEFLDDLPGAPQEPIYESVDDYEFLDDLPGAPQEPQGDYQPLNAQTQDLNNTYADLADTFYEWGVDPQSSQRDQALGEGEYETPDTWGYEPIRSETQEGDNIYQTPLDALNAHPQIDQTLAEGHYEAQTTEETQGYMPMDSVDESPEYEIPEMPRGPLSTPEGIYETPADALSTPEDIYETPADALSTPQDTYEIPEDAQTDSQGYQHPRSIQRERHQALESGHYEHSRTWRTQPQYEPINPRTRDLEDNIYETPKKALEPGEEIHNPIYADAMPPRKGMVPGEDIPIQGSIPVPDRTSE